MLIFSISFRDLIKFAYFMDTLERRVWGERRPKNRVTLQAILVITITRPKTFTQGCVSVFDKYLQCWYWTIPNFQLNTYIIWKTMFVWGQFTLSPYKHTYKLTLSLGNPCTCLSSSIMGGQFYFFLPISFSFYNGCTIFFFSSNPSFLPFLLKGWTFV